MFCRHKAEMAHQSIAEHQTHPEPYIHSTLGAIFISQSTYQLVFVRWKETVARTCKTVIRTPHTVVMRHQQYLLHLQSYWLLHYSDIKTSTNLWAIIWVKPLVFRCRKMSGMTSARLSTHSRQYVFRTPCSFGSR